MNPNIWSKRNYIVDIVGRFLYTNVIYKSPKTREKRNIPSFSIQWTCSYITERHSITSIAPPPSLLQPNTLLKHVVYLLRGPKPTDQQMILTHTQSQKHTQHILVQECENSQDAWIKHGNLVQICWVTALIDTKSRREKILWHRAPPHLSCGT